MTSFITFPSTECVCFDCRDIRTVALLHQTIQERVKSSSFDYYVVCSGRRVTDFDTIKDGATYHVVPRLLGGKGGFGSMLRAIGAQIEKTTNREACRDLSGRRMRDVNNEKRLREWVSKKAEREREREERRRQKRERRRSEPRHNFSDPIYEEQKRQVVENLDDALQEGLKNASASSANGQSLKRKSEEPGPSSSKKAREWFGDDFDSDDISDDNSDTEGMAWPGPSSSHSNSASTSQSGDKNSDVESDSSSESLPNRGEPSDTANKQSESENREPSQSGETEEGSEGQTAVQSKDATGASTDCLVQEPESTKLQSSEEARLAETTDKADAEATKKDAQSADKTEAANTKPEGPVEVDLSAYSSAEALEELGLETLKAALMARGLKCGGTLGERAARLFSVKGLSKDEINPSLFAKGGKVKGKGKK